MPLVWVRSHRVGNPEELVALVDVLRQVQTYLEALDPALRLVATAAEVEARVAQILQLASTPRALGLALAELLLAFLEPYLTDGVYVLTHTNLRHLTEKIGVLPFLPWAQDYLAQADQDHLASPQEEYSSFLNFGPELLDPEEENPLFVAYRSYPAVISGQFDLRERALVGQLTSLAGNTQAFSSFAQWRDELCAAFYDSADPLRPVAAPRDKLGGIILAVAGQDPNAVIETFDKLRGLLTQTVSSWTDFTDVSSALAQKLPGELPDLPQTLKDSLQWTGLQAFLQPYLVRRFSTNPDFMRLSTADALPALRGMILDASNLANFAGVPFPASLGLLDAAELMAKRIELFQQSLEQTVALLTVVMSILDTAGVYRLAIPFDTGGVDGLVTRIREAELDEDVRLTSSSVHILVQPPNLPTITETKLGQITALPDNASDWEGYRDEAVGSFQTQERLQEMEEGFLVHSAPGFEYSAPQVYRKGHVMRRSDALALSAAFPAVGFTNIGDMAVAGLGFFFVEGALGRFFMALFSPQDSDIQEWSAFGPAALLDPQNFLSSLSLAPLPQGDIALPSGSNPRVPNTLAPLPQGNPFEAGSGAEVALPPATQISTQLCRWGATRSYNPQTKSLHSISPTQPRNLVPDATVTMGDHTMPYELNSYFVSGAIDNAVTLEDLPALSDLTSIRPVNAVASLPCQSQTQSSTQVPALGYRFIVDSHTREIIELSDYVLFGGGAFLRVNTMDLLVDMWDTFVTLNEEPDNTMVLTIDAVMSKSVSYGGPGLVIFRTRLDKIFEEGIFSYFALTPALPMPPLYDHSSLKLLAQLQDDPVVLLYGTKPHAPIGNAAYEPDEVPLHMGLLACFQKTNQIRTEAPEEGCAAFLQTNVHGHAYSSDTTWWGSQSFLVATNEDRASLLLSASDAEIDQSTLMSVSFPASVRLLSKAGPVAENQDLGALPLSEARVVATCAYDNDHLFTVFNPDQEIRAVCTSLGEDWRAFTSVLPPYVLIGLGVLGSEISDFVDIAHFVTRVHPIYWYSVFVETSPGVFEDWEQPYFPVSNECELTPGTRLGYALNFTESFLATYRGKNIALLCNAPAPDPDAPIYSKAHGLFVPFSLTDSREFTPFQENDRLLLDPGPHGRQGQGVQGCALLSSTDPAQVYEELTYHLPFTKDLDLRPLDEQGCGIRTRFVMGLNSWDMITRGSNCQLFRGATWRAEIRYGIDYFYVAFIRQEQDSTAWFTEPTLILNLPHMPVGTQVVINFMTQPATGTVAASVWAKTPLEAAPVLRGTANLSSVTVYPCCGLQEGGGSWRIGATVLKRTGQFEATCDPYTMSRPKQAPPIGFVSLEAQLVPVGQEEAFLTQA
jgi:hypothetical protein